MPGHAEIPHIPPKGGTTNGKSAELKQSNYRITPNDWPYYPRNFPNCAGHAGCMSVGLPEGGVLFMSARVAPLKDGKPHELKSRRIVFSDDFKTFEIGTSNVSLPNAVMHTRWAVIVGFVSPVSPC